MNVHEQFGIDLGGQPAAVAIEMDLHRRTRSQLS
jgi:hypothetical protein